MPKFYLNAFKSAEKRIHIFNIRRKLAVQDASLRDQCYAHRLYGEDDIVENALSKIEGVAARVIARIIETDSPPDAGSQDHYVLGVFLALQLNRTIAAISTAREMSRAMGRAAFGDPQAEGFAPSDDEALAMALSAAPRMAETLQDLGMAVINSRPPDSFVTSDNPVVRYNTYCEGITFAGVTGSASSGFQLALPLSPRKLLLLYDRGVYRMGSWKSSKSVAANREDVRQLNRLQVLSANTNVYFHDWSLELGISSLSSKLASIRAGVRPRVNVAEEDLNERSQLIHQFWPMPQMNLDLSFIRIRRNARRISLHDRANSYRPPYVRAASDASVASRARKFISRRLSK